MMCCVPLRSGIVLVKDLPTLYGKLAVIVKKCFMCIHHAQSMEGKHRGGEVQAEEEAKSNLRLISVYLFMLDKLPQDDGAPFPSNKFISFRRKESEGTDRTSKAVPSNGQQTLKRKKTSNAIAGASDDQQTLKRKKISDAGAPQKKQKRSAQPA
ncbi:hypothetical protein Droror1_Dr00024583 [Drosera rotundifolia]